MPLRLRIHPPPLAALNDQDPSAIMRLPVPPEIAVPSADGVYGPFQTGSGGGGVGIPAGAAVWSSPLSPCHELFSQPSQN